MATVVEKPAETKAAETVAASDGPRRFTVDEYRRMGEVGIVQYGILNVNTRELEGYRDPDADGYRTKHTCRADESFALVAFPDLRITVGELLPPQ
jgi:Uma2 family endonuclease